MAIRPITVLLTSLCVAAGLAAQTPAARASAWQADIDSLVARVIRIHPRPWAHVSREAFLDEAGRLRAGAGTSGDPELLAGLLHLMARLEDGHSSITDLGPEGGTWFPVRFQLFADGLWITAIDSAHADCAGARVTVLGALSADSAVSRIVPLVSGDNEFGRRDGVALLANAVLLQALGIVVPGDELPLTLETATGRRSVTLHAVTTSNGDLTWRYYGEMFGPPGIHLVTAFKRRDPDVFLDPAANPDLPLHLRGRRAYWWTVLPDGSVYMQLNSMTGQSHYSPLSLMQTLRQALAHVDSAPGSAPRFILDLRYNSGGDGSLAPGVVNEFVKRDSSIGRRGRFFLVVGRKTFSAAADLTIQLMRYTTTLLAGEPIGVAYNSSGDPGGSTLKRHNIQLAISTNSSWTSQFDSIRLIPVQVPATMTGSLYFAEHDPVLEAILSRPAPYPDILTTLREQGGEAARALWTALRHDYGAVPWWRPFSMQSLNALSYDLLAQHRSDAALVGFAINTEEFPRAWETWDSLGDAYKQAGRSTDALAAYTHALRLAPDNWNAVYQQKMIAELSTTSRP